MTTPGTRDSARVPAFTMVEMVLVMVIITIIAAIAVPRYANTLARYRADLAAARVVADLALARRQAVITSTRQKVSFDVATACYRLQGMNDVNRPGQEYKVWLSAEPYTSALVSVDLGGDVVVQFDQYGLPDSDGTVVIQAGSHVRTIALDPDTGLAKVQ